MRPFGGPAASVLLRRCSRRGGGGPLALRPGLAAGLPLSGAETIHTLFRQLAREGSLKGMRGEADYQPNPAGNLVKGRFLLRNASADRGCRWPLGATENIFSPAACKNRPQTRRRPHNAGRHLAMIATAGRQRRLSFRFVPMGSISERCTPRWTAGKSEWARAQAWKPKQGRPPAEPQSLAHRRATS